MTGRLRPQGILAKSWPICHCPERPSPHALIAVKYAILLTPFSSFFQSGWTMGTVEPSLSAISVRRRYLEMAMGGPRFQKIMVYSWGIRHIPKRPSYRALVSAKHTLFLTPFLIFYQGGFKMGKIEQSLSSIRVWKWYLGTSVNCDSDCPRIQEIMAKSWPICQCP